MFHEYKFRDASVTARRYLYDMTQYCKDNVEKYLKALQLPESSLRRVATPFIESRVAVNAAMGVEFTPTYDGESRQGAGPGLAPRPGVVFLMVPYGLTSVRLRHSQRLKPLRVGTVMEWLTPLQNHHKRRLRRRHHLKV